MSNFEDEKDAVTIIAKFVYETMLKARDDALGDLIKRNDINGVLEMGVKMVMGSVKSNLLEKVMDVVIKTKGKSSKDVAKDVVTMMNIFDEDVIREIFDRVYVDIKDITDEVDRAGAKAAENTMIKMCRDMLGLKLRPNFTVSLQNSINVTKVKTFARIIDSNPTASSRKIAVLIVDSLDEAFTTAVAYIIDKTIKRASEKPEKKQTHAHDVSAAVVNIVGKALKSHFKAAKPVIAKPVTENSKKSCRNADDCYKKDCAFSHPGLKPRPFDKAEKPLDKAEKTFDKAKKPCKNADDCYKKDCAFSHPGLKPRPFEKSEKPCRNEDDCYKKDCAFSHPGLKPRVFKKKD